MRCECLVMCSGVAICTAQILHCNANARPYMPSLFQFEEYCETKYHRKCPFYLQYENKRVMDLFADSAIRNISAEHRKSAF